MDLTSNNKERKRKPAAVDLSTMVYGKVPPQARELEEWVLGAVMMEASVIDTVAEILRPECFYVEAHQTIFSCMLSLQKRSMIIDERSVVYELKAMERLDEVGGPYYIVKLTNGVVSTAPVEQHSRIILQKFLAREVIRISGELIHAGYEDATDIFDLLDTAESAIMGITSSFVKRDFISAGIATAKVVERVDHLRQAQDEFTGVPAGLPSLDRITYGWQPTDLIILAARPSVGKTAFALNLARNAALHPQKAVPVGFFSLEMSAQQLVMRMLSAESEIPIESIMRGKLNDAQYLQFMGKGVKRFESAPVFIDDTAALNIFEFRARARRMVRKYNCGLIIVDYLQLMSGSDGNKFSAKNREQEISNISRNLKALAKELNIPVIALSQLSRALESRSPGKQMPQLSDLRECLAVDEWVYMPSGPVQIGSQPSQIVTLSDKGVITSSCEFIEKKYNTVYKVRTQYGQVRATANHLILTGTGWKKVRDLEIGRDVIAAAKTLAHANRGYQPHGRFLGWMIGNGGFSGTPSLIYRKELDEDVKKEVEKFGVQVRYRKCQKSDNVYDTYLSNGSESRCTVNPVMKWLRELGLEGLTSHNKKIPDQYLGSSNETHLELLQGLWESDGTVTGGIAKFGTVSELLARQVGWLLLTIGVRSTINFYDNLWEVRCSSADNRAMLPVVNNPQRFGKLKDCDADYVDPAPSIFVELAAELTQDRITRFQKKPSGEFKAVSKARLSSVLKTFSIETISGSPYMSLPDVGWGRIISIEREEQEVRVCDLSVPFTHNFIADGIVVHNSGAIEQDADMVMFIYRPEYHDIQNNEHGESTSGETHIKIAKHRNGSLGTIQLQAKLDIQKFEEMPRGWQPTGEGAKLYIDTSRSRSFDDGFKEDQPF